MLGLHNLTSTSSIYGIFEGGKSSLGLRSVSRALSKGVAGLSSLLHNGSKVSGEKKTFSDRSSCNDASNNCGGSLASGTSDVSSHMPKTSHANDGPSDLTKISSLKTMMSHFKDAAVAVLGGLMILAGIYLAFQSSFFLGVPLMLIGAYMVLHAYESWSGFHLLDVFKMQSALDTAENNNNEILKGLVPAMHAANIEITEATQTGKATTTQAQAVVETVSEEIEAARRQAEQMISEIQYDIQEIGKIDHYTHQAIASLQACLDQIKELEDEGRTASDDFETTLKAAQAIQDNPSKIEELKIKLQELEQLQQKIKSIFNSISLIRSQMSATIKELQEIEKSYFLNAEEFENSLRERAQEIKAILEKTGGEMSAVDHLLEKAQSLYVSTLEKAGESSDLINRTEDCSHAIAEQLRIVQDELDQYKAKLSTLQWICALGGGIGALLGAAASGSIAAGLGGAVGARVAFPAYQIGSSLYQWCNGTSNTCKSTSA